MTFFVLFRSIYSPYDPFLATSLAQVQANGLAAAAAAAAGNPGLDPRLQVIFPTLCSADVSIAAMHIIRIGSIVEF